MSSYLSSAFKQFQYYQSLGTRTIEQLTDVELLKEWSPNSNSIAILVNHLHGNMRSRWTDFLTSDGEKPTRDRDSEFEDALKNRAAIVSTWESGWALLFEALDGLQAEDMERIVYIRNQGHTVVEAINRQLCHYAYHVGQIVFIGKLAKGAEWKSLSIPKNQSSAYNPAKFSEEKTVKHFIDEELAS